MTLLYELINSVQFLISKFHSMSNGLTLEIVGVVATSLVKGLENTDGNLLRID